VLVFESISELRQYLAQVRVRGEQIGFVPTMGCLHQGHEALIKQASSENDVAVVSIFLNPTQFSCPQDYSTYPRRLEEDLILAEEAGTSVVFVPQKEELYPCGFQTFVDVRELSKPLCGDHRPGHFIGMATIVLKLFNIVQPDRAYFGQKDFQQACIVKQMAEDLNLTVDVVTCETVREENGLACSSRNVRLLEDDKHRGPEIYRRLNEAAHMVELGITASSELERHIRERLESEGFRVDYVEIVDSRTLLPVENIVDEALIAVAAFLGEIRLIDNILVDRRKSAD